MRPHRSVRRGQRGKDEKIRFLFGRKSKKKNRYKKKQVTQKNLKTMQVENPKQKTVFVWFFLKKSCKIHTPKKTFRRGAADLQYKNGPENFFRRCAAQYFGRKRAPNSCCRAADFHCSRGDPELCSDATLLIPRPKNGRLVFFFRRCAAIFLVLV